MTRVLVNHFSPMPNKITGISVYTWSILSALVKHGRLDYVLSTNWDLDRLPDEVKALGIECVHRDVHRNEAVSFLQSSVQVPAIARRMGCSAILHPQPTAMAAGMSRSVVVIHDLYRVTHAHLFKPVQRFQWNQFTARGFRRAGGLIAVSDATRRDVVAAYPDVADRIHVVHEASPIEADESPAGASPFETPYALMVANVTPNKNVGVLVEALKRLADEGFRPKVVLVGRDEFGVLPGLLGGRSDIDLVEIGMLSDDELRRMYRHARAYVNTSLTEGFCLPLLEAQTLDRPVICSDIPVLREVGGEGGLYVDPKDPRALATAIRSLFEDDGLRDRLVEAGRRNVARFSWRKAALETEALLETLLPSPGASPR